MDLSKIIPALNEPVAQWVFGVLNGRQRKAVEGEELYAVGSATGSVRNSNEDVGLVAQWRQGDSPERNMDVIVVCDGMGGMQHGRFAAQLASSVFVSSLIRQQRALETRVRVERALLSAQNAVFHHLRGEGGTTLSALCVEGNKITLGHVGDSRIYEIDGNGKLNQLSRDDTIGAALNRSDADRHDFGRLIQYVGMSAGDDDGVFEPQIKSITTDITRRGFLVTSDGVHNIGPDNLSRVAHHSRTSVDLVRKLINTADAFGGLDNATAIAVPDHPVQLDGQGLGTSLSLLAPTGASQLWFSPGFVGAQEEAASVAKPVAATSGPVEPPRSPSIGKKPERAATKAKRAPAKRPKRPTRVPDSDLPLGDAPQLSVQFPDDAEGGS